MFIVTRLFITTSRILHIVLGRFQHPLLNSKHSPALGGRLILIAKQMQEPVNTVAGKFIFVLNVPPRRLARRSLEAYHDLAQVERAALWISLAHRKRQHIRRPAVLEMQLVQFRDPRVVNEMNIHGRSPISAQLRPPR